MEQNQIGYDLIWESLTYFLLFFPISSTEFVIYFTDDVCFVWGKEVEKRLQIKKNNKQFDSYKVLPYHKKIISPTKVARKLKL